MLSQEHFIGYVTTTLNNTFANNFETNGAYVSFISEDNHQTVDHLPAKIACEASVSNRVIARKLERDATNSRGNACYASLRTADAFSVVPFFFGGREETTGNASAVRRPYGKKKRSQRSTVPEGMKEFACQGQ